VLANEPISSGPLVEEIVRHARHPEDDVVVVTPSIVDSPLKLGAGEVDSARARAERQLFASLEVLRRAGLRAKGDIGDADPYVALADVLRSAPADEVIVAARPSEGASWLEQEVVARARREFHKPITEVLVDAAQGGSPAVREVLELAPLRDDGEQPTHYIPPLPLRDRIALLVGICGTVTLGVLAMVEPGHLKGSGTAAFALRFLIAIGSFMVTLWHAVALLVFGSLGYRGKWETLAADVVLFGVPAAVAVSLIVGYVLPAAH